MTPYRDLLENWGVAFSAMRKDLAISGSPERCLHRQVIEDEQGSLWLLEQLAPGQAEHHDAIARLLSELSDRGLAGLAPYRRTASRPVSGGSACVEDPNGPFVCRDWGACWQLSPFIQGTPLRQPEYLDDRCKGDSIGGWLAGFRRTALKIEVPGPLFDIGLPGFIADLLSRMAGVRPDVHERAERILPSLGGFLEAYPELPGALCHGDMHPLNVIWGTSGMLAVIDWEFAGVRSELYDLANCLGCAGIEGRGRRDVPFVQALLQRARDEGLIHDNAKWLDSAVLATRFGWLSEWLRKEDEEMIQVELEHMEAMRAGWSCLG